MIGHLQSNKARKAVKLFDVIQTIDSIDLAQRLERICNEENKEELKVFIQVDLAGEKTKSGVSENNLPELIAFLQNCRHLKLVGLMQVPPYLLRQKRLDRIFEIGEIRDKLLETVVSLGMSHDFRWQWQKAPPILELEPQFSVAYQNKGFQMLC